MEYPSSFRCAQIQPYAISVDMGVLRTAMEGGGARQRRLYRTMPHRLQLEFIMTVQELGDWQPWINQNGYDWFTMPLESMLSGRQGEIASPHRVRFTSDLAIDNPVYGWVRIKVGAELEAAQFPLPPSWILGGGPSAPSGDWIIAGTPPAPSPDIISGGSPTQWE